MESDEQNFQQPFLILVNNLSEAIVVQRKRKRWNRKRWNHSPGAPKVPQNNKKQSKQTKSKIKQMFTPTFSLSK
eukprot:4635454-Amphidinium_carterae.1